MARFQYAHAKVSRSDQDYAPARSAVFAPGIVEPGVAADGATESIPTKADIAAAAGELAAVAAAVSELSVPPDQTALDRVQPRVAAVAATVASWRAAPIITSPEPEPELPQPGRIIPATPDTLRARLAEHREPNDRIELAAGVYQGDIDLPFDVPLQLVGHEYGIQKFLGRLALSGTGIVVSGIDCNHAGARNGTSVLVSGTGCRLHRSRIFRSSGHCVDLVGQDCSVEWCDLSIWGKQEVPKGDSSTYFGLIHDPDAKGRRNRIFRCFLHDGPFKAPGDYHKFGITGIGVGVNPRDFRTDSWLEVIENLFQDCGDCDISIKTSRNRIAGNTVLGRRAKSYGNQRSGNHNQWLDNWFDELAYGYEIVVHGGHHLIAGNRARIALRWGNFEWDAMPTGETRHHRAYGVRLVGNEGRVVYGQRYSGEAGKLKLPPKDCVFVGQPFEPAGGIGAKVEDAGTEPTGSARKLTRGEVGPFGRIDA